MVSRAWIAQWYSAGLGAGNLYLHHRVQTGSGPHPASYPMGTWGSFPGREANYSPQSSAKVNNAWIDTSISPLRFHGVVLSLNTGTTFTVVSHKFSIGLNPASHITQV
jgi:hypothetical protein